MRTAAQSFRANMRAVAGTPDKHGACRVVFSPILGGWFIVRGQHRTPIGGRFESRAAALAHLNSRKG